MCSAQPLTPIAPPASQIGERSSEASVAIGLRGSIAAAVLEPACCIRYDALSATAAQIARPMPIEVWFTIAPYAAAYDGDDATHPARRRGGRRSDRRRRGRDRLALRAAPCRAAQDGPAADGRAAAAAARRGCGAAARPCRRRLAAGRTGRRRWDRARVAPAPPGARAGGLRPGTRARARGLGGVRRAHPQRADPPAPA